jgi:hypothetical protein
MLTEDYVGFETAKLLKEKGFDENTSVNYFVGDDKPRGCAVGEMIYHKRLKEDTHLIAAPTLQMAIKWLWETHRLYVSPCLTIKKSGFTFLNQWHCIVEWVDKDNQYDLKCVGEGYSSYQEACEAGIKYCLEKLILI